MPDRDYLKPRYDVVVIGGGVHGAAVALEATRRGREVLLVEKSDFCSGASANSLKIIHGGLRYLQSGNLGRSRESAREQQALMRLAPHLVKPMPCIVGADRSIKGNRAVLSWGVRFYDRVICAGLGDRPAGRSLPAAEANRLAGVDAFRQPGGVLWHDARVLDSERLVLSYLKTAENAGARICNYTEAVRVERGPGLTVTIREPGSGDRRIEADRVIDTASLLQPHRYWARAVNLVIDRPPAECAFGRRLDGVAAREAGRLFFAAPFGERTIVGTWYFPDRPGGPAMLSRAEYHRCIRDAGELLMSPDISASDVSLVHLGRLPVADGDRPLSLLERPLIAAVHGDARVISVTGVKYTTARPAARAALDRAGLPVRRPVPAGRLYGAPRAEMPLEAEVARRLDRGLADVARRAATAHRLCAQYGACALTVVELAAQRPGGFDRVPEHDAIRAEIDYCIDNEHCRTLADFLCRRSGLGSAGPPTEAAVGYCAAVMAERFGWSAERVREEVEALDSHYRRVETEN